MSQSKDLVAASATPLILTILSQSESYGYAIIQEVRRISANEIEWSDGMLYPVLRRLEKQGLVESEWRESESGKRRRYYRTTEAGNLALEVHKVQWRSTNRIFTRLWEEAACLS